MRPTIWLKNNEGDIWNLRPKTITEDYSSFFQAIKGTGFETKLKVSQVQYDFLITEDTPQQIDITGTMYFHSPLNMKRFEEFLGGYENNVKLYYDPEGKIDPLDQISKAWYKVVRITKLESGECDATTGLLVCKMVMTPLSAMWRKDTTIASSTSISEASGHVYPFVYPYFYANDHKLYVNILNSGERIGCNIKIVNKTSSSIDIAWVSTCGQIRQYAKWLEASPLPTSMTLEIDSNPSTQKSVIYSNGSTDLEIDVQDYQEANPAYINFIDLHPGNNLIMFDVDNINGLEIEVSYTEQVRAL